MMIDVQTGLGLLAVAFMAVRSYRRQSLTPSGILAACIVGTIHAIHPYRIILLLLVFFICGTKLTSWGSDIKEQLLHTTTSDHKDDNAATKGEKKEKEKKKGRTAVQVFCNSGPASLCALFHLLLHNPAEHGISAITRSPSDLLVMAIVAQYACSAADTFSSEIGILNDGWPLLITTFRKVPPGTNGAVSVLGLIAALMGGGIIGITSAIVIPTLRWRDKLIMVVIAVVAGLTGSLLDSLLGATCQKTLYNQEMKKVVELHGGGTASHEPGEEGNYIVLGYDLLDNNQVNLVSALLTMLLTVVTLVCFDFVLSSIF